MKETFDALQEAGITVYVHSIYNKFNETTEDIESLFQFLKNYRNIGVWRLDKAAASLYQGKGIVGYDTFKPDLNKLREIEKYIEDEDFRKKCSFKIIYEGLSESNIPLKEKDNRPNWTAFNNRSLCTANFSQMYILPDGNVTICEELYWTKGYIIGNVLKNSLLEIWNSDTALNLYNVKQEKFPNNTPCKTCETFEQCRKGKGVCIRDILKTNGMDKWYYPDTKCPKAVEGVYKIYV